MTTWLYLTHTSSNLDDCRLTWWNLTQAPRSASVQDAASELAGQPLTLLLPIEIASYHQVEVPARSGRWLKQAICSALEEKLLDELDTLHIARSALQQQRYCGVFALRREPLRALLLYLANAGLEPEHVYLDADCLPGEQPLALWCNGRWLLGNLADTRMALEEQQRSHLQTRLSPHLHWQGGQQRPEGLAAEHPWLTSDEETSLRSLQASHAIDLRQGEFRYNAPRRLGWRLPASLLALGFIALLTHTVSHRLLLEQQTAALHSQNVSEFQQRFADEQRIVNLRQQVAARQQAPQTTQQNLARRLEQLASKWLASGGSAAAIRQVQYRAGEGWNLQVTAPAFADLEQIRDGLTRQNLNVQSNSTVRDANGVSSQFRVGE